MGDVLVVFLAIIAFFVVLDIAAVHWGVDSRPALGDDHRRRAS